LQCLQLFVCPMALGKVHALLCERRKARGLRVLDAHHCQPHSYSFCHRKRQWGRGLIFHAAHARLSQCRQPVDGDDWSRPLNLHQSAPGRLSLPTHRDCSGRAECDEQAFLSAPQEINPCGLQHNVGVVEGPGQPDCCEAQEPGQAAGGSCRRGGEESRNEDRSRVEG